MRLHSRRLYAIVLSSALAGCSWSAHERRLADGSWVGTITTEGNVTTVVNESGAVWGGEAQLVEEASIGAASGDDAYVFSEVRSLAATDDRIYVLDRVETTVRVYDMDGGHLFDIGSEGEGPGEFRVPWAIGLSRGRLLVFDTAQARLHVFSLDGELLEDWPAPGGLPVTIADEGLVYAYTRLANNRQDGVVRFGVAVIGPEGRRETIPIPVFEHPRPLIPVDRNFLELGTFTRVTQGLVFTVIDIPFAINPQWVMASDGTLLWGETDTHGFTLERADGSVVHVERRVDPVAVDPDESRWHRDRLTRFWRDLVPEFTWTGDEIPPTKRAFAALTQDRDGRVWVLRELAGVPLADCDRDPEDLSGFLERPCWRQPFALDAFGADGRYLGRVRIPEETRVDVTPFISGDTMIAAVEDSAGTLMVKRYRLVLPQDEQAEGPSARRNPASKLLETIALAMPLAFLDRRPLL